jgi:hypothetical protein
VAEISRLPGAGAVTGRALTAIMVGRFVPAVARLAVRLPLVVEAGRLPGTGAVTTRALAAVMVGWFIAAVTRLAVRRTRSRVIELGRSLPGAGSMAV